MDFVCNFPAISILMSLFSGIISSGLKQRAARMLNSILLLTVIALNATAFVYTLGTGQSFVYVMGKFPAPWGNEIRAGVLETMMATVFSLIMLLSLLGGEKKLHDEVEEDKIFLYYVLNDLLLSSLLALIYTNDIFTAYVFIEINTIAACGLIMIRQNGRTIEASVRYMIMSLLGSGMILLSICLLYDITGHLLMSNIKEEVISLYAGGNYSVPLTVAISLICVGLAIKSALFPFHSWLPDAYGYSTVSSAAILSSLVSKGYIFLLIKIFYRVIGLDIIRNSKIINVLFVFGLAGMIFGSLSAMKEGDIRRMIAFSSVAQIGYIYMGFGLGTEVGMIASVFHILTHAATKSLLFISAIGLTEVSGGSRHFNEVTGAGFRNMIAGIGFTVGSLSMVGLPAFAGFISKILFAQAALNNVRKMLPVLIVLGISTILNAIYFLKTVLRIYTPVETSYYKPLLIKDQKLYSVVIIMFVIINFILGLLSGSITNWITLGLEMFA
ncbi:MAG: sodium:proton antiporter [Lachnospiraceae bacterium]|nr:sodium:proton antiporter [Lachnospiraceae bacterium]